MRLRMDDDTIVDTTKASQHFAEDTYFDGRNRISKATGDQFLHQDLYRSRKGRYYLVHHSDWQGSRPHAEWLSKQAAARWLLLNEIDLPEDLVEFAEAVSE